MSLNQFIDKWTLRQGARMLQKSHTTVHGWLNSGKTFQIMMNSDGLWEVWEKK